MFIVKKASVWATRCFWWTINDIIMLIIHVKFVLHWKFHIEDSRSIKSISEVANLSPNTNTLFLCKSVYTHRSKHQWKDTSHTHTHTHALLPLLPDFWPTGPRPMTFTHFRSNKHTHTASHINKIKHTPNRRRESRFKEVYSERLKRFESRQEVGTQRE